jgi:hypothetical protein
MFVLKRIKVHLFFEKFVAFLLLANLIFLPLAVNFTHICFEEIDVGLQHNTHSHRQYEGYEAFANDYEFKSQLCYACIYSATLSVISPIDTNPDYSAIFDTLNPVAEQIFTSSFQFSQSSRAPPSIMA